MPVWSANTERCGICNSSSHIVKECRKCGQKGCQDHRNCMGGNPGKCPKCGGGCKISNYKPISNKGKPHV